MRFFLGTHRPHWLAETGVPMFVSDRQLRRYKTLPRARGPWALDSGGFTELSSHGSWDQGPTPAEYVGRIRRYARDVGNLAFAAPQDWMVEPAILAGGQFAGMHFAGTGLSVPEHQRRTVDNFLALRDLAPDLPIIPVLQGWTTGDYLRCADVYAANGVELDSAPIVGLGSVCRRQATSEAAEIIAAVVEAIPGIRIHGFGIKTAGLAAYGQFLDSADSMAWSFRARRSEPLPGCPHRSCTNCRRFATQWREHVLDAISAGQDHQMGIQVALFDSCR
ncbi:deazapurine DNA modification protein DpdA family protein [Nocardia thailandica]